MRGALRGLSWPFQAITFVRRRAYRLGVLPVRAAAIPVISVGNITVGGTGKTPLVAWLVRLMREAGHLPAVLTRGYRASASQGYWLGGGGGLADEAQELREATGAMVVVNPNRWAGARKAAIDGADVCILDDGFQHLRLRRDLDIVTLDATCPFGYDAVVPRGLLREPLGALRQAGAVVITRCDLVTADVVQAIRNRLAGLAPRALVAESVMKATRVRRFDGQVEELEDLENQPVWAFCGLGNPPAFYATLAATGANVVGATTFNDHHIYSAEDIAAIASQAELAGATRLITTGKDAAKLHALAAGRPMGWLEVELAITSGERELVQRITQAAH